MWEVSMDGSHTPNLEGHVPVFISPKITVAQLYRWELGLSITFTYYCMIYL
jgi:hypothetical protein